MPAALVECIPNFSEARRPEVVEAILEAIRSVPEVHVLDCHSDLDHNRTVITFVAPPQAVEEAAFRGIARAAELIDLNVHTGQHPRIGAADVVPFVPLVETSMLECVELSRRLGKRVAAELNLPVYLYEESATRPERQNLENIRSGEFETLKKEIGSSPSRNPDFGPRSLGPAGAVVIGARQPLIAFNVYLATDNVSIAQKVARAVRYSSGGLRNVKAIGVQVHGLAQVSMNLTNFRQTPVGRVVEMVRREAAAYGVTIHHCELVGLIPQDGKLVFTNERLQTGANFREPPFKFANATGGGDPPRKASSLPRSNGQWECHPWRGQRLSLCRGYGSGAGSHGRALHDHQEEICRGERSNVGIDRDG